MKIYKVTYKVNENGGVFKHQISFKRYFSSLKKAKNSIQDLYAVYKLEAPIFDNNKYVGLIHIDNINYFTHTNHETYPHNIEIIEVL